MLARALKLVTSVLVMLFWNPLFGQSIADTFDTSEIPTSLGAYSSTCNGPLTTIQIKLPPGGPWTVTGIDISYNMTAQGGGLKSHQRSYIRCQNTTTSESSIFQGTGNGGVQAYNRTGVLIANGSYSGNTMLRFEMRAWRTAIGSGCNTTNNRVDNFTWIINVHYGQIPDEGSVGIGTTMPAASAILDLSSTTQAFLPPRMTTQQRDAIAVPIPGMMIFNLTTQNLEIFSSGWGTVSFSSPGVKKLLGGSNNVNADSDSPACIEQTADGGYIVAGTSNSSNAGTLLGLINNGSFDYWIIKFDNQGNIMWQKLYGGSASDNPKCIRQTSDGGYIVAGNSLSSNSGTLAGLTNNGTVDYWILRLDSSGNILWQKLIGGNTDDYGTWIQEISGGYIVCGYSLSSNSGTLSGLISNGGYDMWILKLDTGGNILWQKLLGGNAGELGGCIEPTKDDGFIIACYSNSSNSGTMLGLTNNGDFDLWVLKLDSNGNVIWQKLLGGNSAENANSVSETSDGGFIIAGYSISSNSGTLSGITNNGTSDVWILKLDDSGNTVWQKLLGGTQGENASRIQQTNAGGFIVSASSNSSNTGTLSGYTNNGFFDSWIFKLDGTGTIVWQRLYGGSNSEFTTSIQQTSDGGYIIASDSYSSNTGTLLGLISNGGLDYWIFKLDGNGNFY